MHLAANRMFTIALGVVAAASVGVAYFQWRETVRLQVQVTATRAVTSELAALRAENRQLQAKQISESALELMRADHAALPRLRAELEALRKAIPAANHQPP